MPLSYRSYLVPRTEEEHHGQLVVKLSVAFKFCFEEARAEKAPSLKLIDRYPVQIRMTCKP